MNTLTIRSALPRSLSVWATAAVLTTTVTAHAEDDPKVLRAKVEAAVEKSAKKTGEQCGTKLDVMVDFGSFPEEKRKKYSLGSFCGEPVQKLGQLCRGPATSKYVAKAVKAYLCRHAKDGKRKLFVKKGVLTYEVDFEAKNNYQFARRELVRNL